MKVAMGHSVEARAPLLLVVDDDHKLVPLLERGLRYEGFGVACAYSGTEGLSAARSTTPDLVLLDVGMPDLDLLPVLTEHIRTRPPDEPPYTAILNSLLTVGAERPGGVGILFSGPPARFPASTRRPDAVLLQFEDGIAAALAERLDDSGDALRASVLARAAVGAIRTTLITYAYLPDENKTMATALRLVQDAFAALQSGR